MFLQAQNAKFFVRGVGGWGYVNVPWTCKDGWMLYNRCWRNINMYNCMLPYQLYVGPLNSEAGQTDGMGAVKLGAFYRTLVLIKTKRNWDILRSPSINYPPVLMSKFSKLVNDSSLYSLFTRFFQESAAWGFTQPKTWMMRCLLAALLRFCSLTKNRDM